MRINTPLSTKGNRIAIQQLAKAVDAYSSPEFAGLILSGLTANGVCYVDSDLSITADPTNFYWDDTNKRLGIRTNLPQASLHIDAPPSAGQTSLLLGDRGTETVLGLADIYPGISFNSYYTDNWFSSRTDYYNAWFGLRPDTGIIYFYGANPTANAISWTTLASIDINNQIFKSNIPLTVESTTTPQLNIKYDGSNYGSIESSNSGNLIFKLTGTQVAFKVNDETEASYQTYLFDNAHSSTPIYSLLRSHSDTLNSIVETESTDYLGSIYFSGVDTVPQFNFGAIIRAVQNGSSGAYVPTDLYLLTYSDTAVNTSQLVLASDGKVGIGISNPARKLDVYDNSGNPQLKLTYDSIYDNATFYVDGDGYLTITPSGGIIDLDSKVTVELAASDSYGLRVDGETNPYVYSSGDLTFNTIKRKVVDSGVAGSSYPDEIIYNYFLSEWAYGFEGDGADLSGSTVLGSKINFSLSQPASGDGFVVNDWSGKPASYETDLIANYDVFTCSTKFEMDYAGKEMIFNLIGGKYEFSGSAFAYETDGDLVLNVIGGEFNANLLYLVSGDPTVNFYGGRFIAEGRVLGTCTTYGGYFSATDGDTNYDMYAANTGSMNIIAGNTRIGSSIDPTNTLSLPLDSKIDFGDNAVYIFSDDDGYLDLVADVGIRLSGAFISVPDEITATSEGVAASLTTINTEVTTNGDSDLDNVTLANGASGQIKCIYCVVEGNAADTWKITPATMCGGTQITFSGIGEGCILKYADNEGWTVVANNGGTIT